MKALSIRQPWAWLIVHGHKDIENRTWTTPFRGRFLVHAGQSFDHNGYRWVQSHMGVAMPEPARFERGGIVGVADLLHCVSQHQSPWFSGPHGFVLANPRPLPFRPLSGRLGFFEVEDDDERVDELEQKVGVVVEFDAGRRAVLMKLLNWLPVGHRIRVRKPRKKLTKNKKDRWIQNPQELRLKFKMTVGKILLDGKSLDKGFPGQVVWVLRVPSVEKEDEPEHGDWVFRVWEKKDGDNGPPVDMPEGPIPRPQPPDDPPPPVEPPDPKPPDPEPPDDGDDDDDDEDGDEKPDLPDPDDFDDDGRGRKGRRVGG